MKLLERQGHLDELHAILVSTGKDGGRLVLVSGEAGIGKTSLVERFLSEQLPGQTIFTGACDNMFAPRPFGPLYEIAQPALPELAAALQQRADSLEAGSVLLNSLVRLKDPSILVVEDVHWADEATLDVLKYVGRRIRQTRTLLLLTYRDDEIGPAHPLRILLGELAASSPPTRIRLRDLSQEAVRELASGTDIDPVVLHQQTGGNPFFITEALNSREGGIPQSVRDAVLARASRLSPDGRAILDAAAVLGPRVEVWLLEKMDSYSPSAVDECLASGVLRGQSEYLIFRHELSRQAVLEAIPPQRAIDLHRQALTALRSDPLLAENLARQVHHALGAHDHAAVLELAPLAAQIASRANAHRAAASLLASAAQYSGGLPAEERWNLLLSYAQETSTTDDIATSINILQSALSLARLLGDARKEGQALSLLSVAYVRSGQNAAAETTSLDAVGILQTLPESIELAQAYRDQGFLRMLNRDNREAVDWAEKAVRVARRLSDMEMEILADQLAGMGLLMASDPTAIARLENSIDRARQAGMEEMVALCYSNLGSGLGELHQFHPALKYLEAALVYTTEREMDYQHAYSRAWLSLVLMYLGRWSEAAASATQVLSKPSAAVISVIMAQLCLGRLRARRGDPGVWKVLDEALMLSEKTATLQRLAPAFAARAEAAWLEGNLDLVRKEASTVYELAESKLHPWFTGELAFWRFQAGESIHPPEWIAVPFALQIAGEWERAAQEWERLGCPYERARALASGNPAAQRQALEIYEQLGAVPAADALRQALRTQGVRSLPRGPRRETRQNPFNLTSREVEILSLLSEGSSNSDISARLYISVRTVEHHVSAVLSKLGVQSRSEAAALFLRSSQP